MSATSTEVVSRPVKETQPALAKRMGMADPLLLKRNNLDFLRFALAVLVIFSHSYALLSGSDDSEPLSRATGGQLTFGALAVNWFFVISGFLITHSWLKSGGVGRFVRNRVFRIYPAFIVAMLFCGLVAAPLASRQAAEAFTGTQIKALITGSLTLRGYGFDGAFLNNPYPRAVNGSMWSISYECWCYVGVALLGLAGLLKRRRFVMAVFAVLILVSVVFLVFHLRPGGKWLGAIFGSPRLWARLLPYYLAGVVFYLFRDRLVHSGWLAGGAGVLLLAGSFIPQGLAVALPTAGTYLLFWFAFHPAIHLDRWAAHGDFSYGIYLYAFPVQQLLIQRFPALGTRSLFCVAMLLSLAGGFASWHLVEKHFLARKLKPTPPVEARAGVAPEGDENRFVRTTITERGIRDAA